MERLLELLQNEARLTVREISVMLNEPEDKVAAEIKRLEKDGVINGYHALINWEKTEIPKATALIELKITPKKDTGFDEVANRVMGFTEVESVYLMSGGYDLTVIVTGKTMQDIAMFVSRRLSTIEGVLSTATHFVLTKYKDGGVVFDDNYEVIDERGGNLVD